MKKLFFTCFLFVFANFLFAQKANNEIKLSDLAVPNSPSFILVDLSPSIIQTPNTPKSFVIGLAQSFQQSSDGWPQNYSVEFSPYWWFNNKNVYGWLGLKTMKDSIKTKDGKKIPAIKEDIWSGAKFVSLSMAFMNKDLIPDTINLNQKVFSGGIRTTIIKIHQKEYAKRLSAPINEWHAAALAELTLFDEQVARAKDNATREELNKLSLKYKPSGSITSNKVKEISDIMNEKPIFSWDIAAAYAVYGIDNRVWMSGRYGFWTNFSSYIPLDNLTKKKNEFHENYFNANISVRYLYDNYYKDKDALIIKTGSIDVGGKLAFEFKKFSFGVESLYRFNNISANTKNRTVGVINCKITDNLYVNAAFGKNFDMSNKLISVFGINWGFGSEKVNLPD